MRRKPRAHRENCSSWCNKFSLNHFFSDVTIWFLLFYYFNGWLRKVLIFHTRMWGIFFSLFLRNEINLRLASNKKVYILLGSVLSWCFLFLYVCWRGSVKKIFRHNCDDQQIHFSRLSSWVAICSSIQTRKQNTGRLFCLFIFSLALQEEQRQMMMANYKNMKTTK